MNAIDLREAALAKFLDAKQLVGPIGEVPNGDLPRFDALMREGLALDRQFTALAGIASAPTGANLDERLDWYTGRGEGRGMVHSNGASQQTRRPGEVLVLGPSDKLAAYVPHEPGPQMSVGQMVHGMVYGDWGSYARPMAQMGIGTQAGGGYLVRHLPPHASSIWRAHRPASCRPGRKPSR